MKKVAALIVTYNRKEWLKRNLKSIFSQTRLPDAVFVVDNASTDGTDKFLEETYKDKIVYVKLDQNTGGSGGFYSGIKTIHEIGEYDWIWLMDDDAIPSKYALQTLLRYTDSKKIGVLQNEMITDEEKFLNSDKLSEQNTYLKKRFFGMFVGYMISTKVIDEIGYPDKDFFIYYDDSEYTFRVMKFGFRIYTVKGSYIFHRDWLRLTEKIKKFPFSKPKISHWKIYYIFRNAFYIFKNPIFKYPFLFFMLYIDRYIWIYLDSSYKDYIEKGISDGKNGIKGRVLHP
jgi:GT2 family glycosyltransferase